jgi:hypothetical protein
MIDRLRFLLDRPLDPPAARAVVVFATAIMLGFGALFVLGASESSPPRDDGVGAVAAQSRPGRLSFGAPQVEAPSPGTSSAPRQHRQDPQDEKGSPAADRASRAMRSHRALQHVPFRSGHLSVRLAGARGGRAVLAVSAPTISAARRGWRRFLRQYRDAGNAYFPRFEETGGHRG